MKISACAIKWNALKLLAPIWFVYMHTVCSTVRHVIILYSHSVNSCEPALLCYRCCLCVLCQIGVTHTTNLLLTCYMCHISTSLTNAQPEIHSADKPEELALAADTICLLQNYIWEVKSRRLLMSKSRYCTDAAYFLRDTLLSLL